MCTYLVRTGGELFIEQGHGSSRYALGKHVLQLHKYLAPDLCVEHRYRYRFRA